MEASFIKIGIETLGVPDNVRGVSYRTRPRAYTDHIYFDQLQNEPRAVDKYPDNVREYCFWKIALVITRLPMFCNSCRNLMQKFKSLLKKVQHLFTQF